MTSTNKQINSFFLDYYPTYLELKKYIDDNEEELLSEVANQLSKGWMAYDAKNEFDVIDKDSSQDKDIGHYAYIEVRKKKGWLFDDIQNSNKSTNHFSLIFALTANEGKWFFWIGLTCSFKNKSKKNQYLDLLNTIKGDFDKAEDYVQKYQTFLLTDSALSSENFFENLISEKMNIISEYVGCIDTDLIDKAKKIIGS